MKELTKAEMKSVIGGTEQDPGVCESTCQRTADCATDRTCKSAICDSDPKVEFYSCFRY